MTALHRPLGAALAGAALALAAGCTNLPEVPLHPAESAVEWLESTPMARLVAESTPPGKQALSGVRLLAGGLEAFDARIALARHATRTLDLQTYLLADDATGRRLLRELRDAAQRGVRVRVLLDDLHSGESMDLLSGLAAHERVEVRLFNPLPVRVGSPMERLAFSAHRFEQLHRRMHNKLLIADGHLAITGGRNIGDEYFMHASAANFVDTDLLVGGAALPALNQAFERYWNSGLAYPLHSLQPDTEDPAVLRKHFAERTGDTTLLQQPARRDLLGASPLSEQIAQGHLEMHYGKVQVLTDAPQKVSAPARLDDSALGQGLQRLRQARSDVVIVSPYFIPGVRGMAMIREARATKVRVTVLTNSLAATDEPMVHRAYSRYRGELLDLGVALYELSPGLSRKTGLFGDFRSSEGRLHAKVAVADRRWVLMGSMNMDARSALANTELGLLVDSPALAWELRELWQRAHASSTYRLRRVPQGDIEWIAPDGGADVMQRSEPGADIGLQLKLSLLSFFVSEELL